MKNTRSRKKAIKLQDYHGQEFERSLVAAIPSAHDAKFFAQADAEERITSVPYYPAVPVTTGWDFSMGDHNPACRQHHEIETQTKAPPR